MGDVLTIALVVYLIGAVDLFTIGLVNRAITYACFDCRYNEIPDDQCEHLQQQRTYWARFALRAPLWPLSLLTSAGRFIGQLMVDARRG